MQFVGRGADDRTPDTFSEDVNEKKPSKMHSLNFTIIVLLLALMIVTTEGGKNKPRKEKTKNSKGGTECSDWRYGNCVPNNGDCGVGLREGNCSDQTRNLKCKVPCNWKKEFGADCKYKFGRWGKCNAATESKSRSGSLKKALFNAECLPIVTVNKPCAPKPKTKSKGKKGKERKTKEQPSPN